MGWIGKGKRKAQTLWHFSSRANPSPHHIFVNVPEPVPVPEFPISCPEPNKDVDKSMSIAPEGQTVDIVRDRF